MPRPVLVAPPLLCVRTDDTARGAEVTEAFPFQLGALHTRPVFPECVPTGKRGHSPRKGSLLCEKQTRRTSRLLPHIIRERGKQIYRPGGVHAARHVDRGLWEGPR